MVTKIGGASVSTAQGAETLNAGQLQEKIGKLNAELTNLQKQYSKTNNKVLKKNLQSKIDRLKSQIGNHKQRLAVLNPPKPNSVMTEVIDRGGTTPKQEPAKGKGIFGKIGDWFSKNGKTFKKMGKFVGLAALFGALGVGIYSLTKKDDKVNEIPPEQTAIIPPEEQEPQVEEVPNVEEKPEIDAKQEQVETLALKGSDYWKYAKFELLLEHQGEAGYVPKDSEINERMNEIMKRGVTTPKGNVDKVEMAEDGIHSKPLLMQGDGVRINKETAEVIDEAVKQLKEEHKDKPDFEPTYRQVQRKVKEILSEKQAA